MKMKKILVSSLATIALAGSLASGATYALFTSSSDVNIAITAGKVKVSATLEHLELTSLGDVQGGLEFANGGEVIVNGGELILDRVTPGDAVKFDIKVVNESNVTVQYRTVIECLAGYKLFSALEITYHKDGEATADDLSGYVLKEYAWEVLQPDPTPDVNQVSIHFPEACGNEYQGLATKMAIKVEVVQGNGSTAQMEMNNPAYRRVKTIAALNEALEDDSVKKIIIDEGNYIVGGPKKVYQDGEPIDEFFSSTPIYIRRNVEVVGIRKDTVQFTGIYDDGHVYSPSGVFFFKDNANGASLANLTIKEENEYVKTTQKDPSLIVIHQQNQNLSTDPIVIEHVDLLGSCTYVPGGSTSYYSVVGIQPFSGNVASIIVQDCYLEKLQYSMYVNTADKVTILRNKFDTSKYNAVAVTGATYVNISDNTMINIADYGYNDERYCSAITINKTITNYVIENNEITLSSNVPEKFKDNHIYFY